MAPLTHWKGQLKRGLLVNAAMCEALAPAVIEACCPEAGHAWRDSFWSASTTFVTFLLQVLDDAKTLRAAAGTLLAQFGARGDAGIQTGRTSTGDRRLSRVSWNIRSAAAGVRCRRPSREEEERGSETTRKTGDCPRGLRGRQHKQESRPEGKTNEPVPFVLSPPTSPASLTRGFIRIAMGAGRCNQLSLATSTRERLVEQPSTPWDHTNLCCRCPGLTKISSVTQILANLEQ